MQLPSARRRVRGWFPEEAPAITEVILTNLVIPAKAGIQLCDCRFVLLEQQFVLAKRQFVLVKNQFVFSTHLL